MLLGRNKTSLQYAFLKTLPILFSYVFLGMAFGILMRLAGYRWYWSVLVSLCVYSGAFQFALVPFLVNQTPLSTVALTALFMSSRHTFYGLSFLDVFSKMKRVAPYMIFSLTDETYSLYCSLDYPENTDQNTTMFSLAVLCHIYWISGSLLGALAGEYLSWDFSGMEFCMTALFITILLDQWRTASTHIPALVGLSSAVCSLLLFGADAFLLPALLLTVAVLMLLRKKIEGEETA